MPNPIAARWESSKLQLHPKTLHPSSHCHRQPNHSYPCPPHPARPREDGEWGDRARKRKHSPGMYQHTNMASAQALRSPPLLFFTRCFGLGSARPARRKPQNFWYFSASTPHRYPHHLCVHPPQLQSLWECFVQTQLCRARTVVRYIKSGEHGYKDHWPPSALKGLISTDRPALCPPRREGGMLFQSSPVHSDGWGSILLRVPTFLMIRVSFERFTTT